MASAIRLLLLATRAVGELAMVLPLPNEITTVRKTARMTVWRSDYLPGLREPFVLLEQIGRNYGR